MNGQLETVSIAELLQNRQHAHTPYLGQIRHVTLGQWSMLRGLILYCVAHAGQETAEMLQFRSDFYIYFFWEGSFCAHRPLPIQAKFDRKQ